MIGGSRLVMTMFFYKFSSMKGMIMAEFFVPLRGKV
jgi:hypothetical protein